MIAFVILVASVIASWFVLSRTKSVKINKKRLYCILCGVFFVLVAGTRLPSYSFGDDSMYMRNYDMVQRMSFTEVYDWFKRQDTEVVFYEFTKVVSLVSPDYNVLLTVCSVPVVFAISWLIYKHSKNPMLSYLVFACAFFFLWSLVILRQALAMSVIIFAMEFLSKKRYGKFLVALLIAALFHRTAVVFILALPLSFFRYSKKSAVVFSILCIISLAFGELLVNTLLGAFTNAGHFGAYLARNASFGNWRQLYKFLIYGALTIPVIVFTKRNYRVENSFWIHLCLTGCLLCALSPFFAETFRLGLYFLLPLIFLLPNAIECLKTQKIKVISSVVLIAFLIVLGFVTFRSMGYENILIM